MKTKFLLAFSFLTYSLFSQAYDLTQLNEHLERQQYKKLQQAVRSLPENQSQPELLVFQAKAMLSLQEDEALEEMMPKLLQTFPNHAELLYLASANQFNLAQSGSMFSAPGRAKQGLTYLKQAVKADPTNYKYQQTLIGFYLNAPGIAGGDEKEAKHVADLLLQQDAIQGAMAQATILQKNDQPDQALALLQSQLAVHPTNTALIEAKAALLAAQKKTSEAFVLYQQTLSLYPKEVEKYNSLYQLGRLAAVENQDAAIGTAALQQYLEFYQDSDNPMYPWAVLRLAQIQLRVNDKTAATATIQPLLAKAPTQERLQKELKNFKKQLSSAKS